MSASADTPPRAPPVKYATPLGTRWQKEKAAAGTNAFEYPDDAKYVGPWVIGECVGKGASGRVKIARHRRTGQLAAVKILPLQPFLSSRNTSNTQAKAEKQRLGIDREIIMMKLMNHPNIMRIYDVYEGDRELYLILEYVEGGELFDFLVNRGRLPPLEALAYFKQIIYGLNYAHTFSIIHRDLKPENILIHSLNPPLVKIADWGMAAFAPPTLQLETSCGSPHYASPEIVNGQKYCGTATDIWSCGVILYALLTGRLPFDDKNVRQLLSKVKAGNYNMPASLDPIAKDLLSRMLVVDVNKRISMAEILVHPWLEGSTPGITYVSAPPVSELAKPLPSALHIDRDLFESLCVIWGRHADVDCIRADLLSPPGQGTLAKAFYFLLQNHRAMTMEEHGILMDIDEVLSTSGKAVTKQYAAPCSALGRRSLDLARPLQVMPPSQYLRSERPAPQPPSRSSSPQPPLKVTTALQMERTSSRAHPPSPVGPRPQRPRQQGARNSVVLTNPPSFVPNPDIIRGRSQTVGPSQNMRAHSGVRQSQLPIPSSMERGAITLPVQPRTSVHNPSFPGSGQDSQHPASVIHAPVPIPASAHSVLPTLMAPRVAAEASQTEASLNPVLTTPRCPEVDMLDRAHPSAAPGNGSTVQWNFHERDAMLPPRIQRPEHRPSLDEQSTRRPIQWSGPDDRTDSKGTGSENKENRTAPARPPQHDPACQSGGLGFGHSIPMAKEMGNMVFIHESGNTQQGKKDKKARPPPLDFHGASILQKRATFSVGSPHPGSPTSSAMSPAVGEFKGWFSNLFPWKVQSTVLYSVLDLATTRAEITRLLENFGVSVAIEDKAGWTVLLCRADELHDASGVVLKQVRFRVEFSPYAREGTGISTLNHVGATPRMGQTSFPGGRSRVDRPEGYETIIGIALEKGSVSTFKNLCQRLRFEWRLDALVSPIAVPMPGIQQQFIV